MRTKLIVKGLTVNEDGSKTTRMVPELVDGISGAFVSGEIFLNVPSEADQPEALVYNAVVSSDLVPFAHYVNNEDPEATT